MHFVVTGPESSGKTTLSISLSRFFQSNYIPEYARHYLTYIKQGQYTVTDLNIIAKKTAALQNSKALKDGYVMDTGYLVLKIWTEVRFESTPSFIEEQFVSDDAMYFLCKPEMPWVEGPLRENPVDRDDLFEIYLQHLKNYQKSYHIVSGNEEERFKKCREIMMGYLE